MRYNNDFEWDEQKNVNNFKKHGVWFYEAATVWSSMYFIERYDFNHSIDEDRFIVIGPSKKGRLLVVIFTERIISSRVATLTETGEYEKGI